ncbi:hypothetical protein J6590_046289 [Homalodisca vitripennis]|nr:hypothetical protein J6590_046289 [Homalodisca vitripennis]
MINESFQPCVNQAFFEACSATCKEVNNRITAVNGRELVFFDAAGLSYCISKIAIVVDRDRGRDHSTGRRRKRSCSWYVEQYPGDRRPGKERSGRESDLLRPGRGLNVKSPGHCELWQRVDVDYSSCIVNTDHPISIILSTKRRTNTLNTRNTPLLTEQTRELDQFPSGRVAWCGGPDDNESEVCAVWRTRRYVGQCVGCDRPCVFLLSHLGAESAGGPTSRVNSGCPSRHGTVRSCQIRSQVSPLSTNLELGVYIALLRSDNGYTTVSR